MKRFMSFVFCLLCSVNVYAKLYNVVPEVEEIVYKGVVYKANNLGLPHGKDQNGGYVQAYDYLTQAKLWEKKVYDSAILIGDRQDIDNVFIVRLDIKDDLLYVTTSDNRIFTISIFSPEHALDENVGKEFQIEGTALNYSHGAAVRNGLNFVFIENLGTWPQGVEGNSVKVKGILLKKSFSDFKDSRVTDRASVDAYYYVLSKSNWAEVVPGEMQINPEAVGLKIME